MNITPATTNDAKEILDLLIKTPQLQGCGEMDAVYSLDFVLDSIKDKDINLVLVAKEKEKIVGLLVAEIWDKKKYSFLVDFVIIPEFRKKGIGTELYNYYEKHCKKHNLKTITALVQKSNLIMQEFCKNKGYKQGHELYFYEKEL